MKKAVFLASLAVISMNVLGMNPLDNNNLVGNNPGYTITPDSSPNRNIDSHTNAISSNSSEHLNLLETIGSQRETMGSRQATIQDQQREITLLQTQLMLMQNFVSQNNSQNVFFNSNQNLDWNTFGTQPTFSNLCNSSNIVDLNSIGMHLVEGNVQLGENVSSKRAAPEDGFTSQSPAQRPRTNRKEATSSTSNLQQQDNIENTTPEDDSVSRSSVQIQGIDSEGATSLTNYLQQSIEIQNDNNVNPQDNAIEILMVNSSNMEDTHNARIAIRSAPYVKAKEIIQDKLNGDKRVTQEFFKNLLDAHNLNLDKFILESTPDEIVDKLNWLEGSISDEWRKEAKNILTQEGVLGVNEKSTNDLIKSLVYLRDKQKKQGQKIDPKVISALKHAFECKDLFLCLFDIRSKILSDEIYRFLLMYKNKNKTIVNANELNDYINDKVKNFLKTAYIYAQKDLLNFLVKKDEKYMLKIMLGYGADINKEGNFKRTPLFDACESGNLDLVKYLIKHGANINQEDNWGKTPLFDACELRNLDVVKYLVEEQGVDVSKEDEDGKTPLFYACESGSLDLVKYLIEHGADVNKEDEYGERPLGIAYYLGYGNIIGYLEGKGAVRGESEQFSDYSGDE